MTGSASESVNASDVPLFNPGDVTEFLFSASCTNLRVYPFTVNKVKNEHKLQRDGGVCLSELWVEHPKGLRVCSVGERWHRNIRTDQQSSKSCRLAGTGRRLLLTEWDFLPWKIKNWSKQTSHTRRRTNICSPTRFSHRVCLHFPRFAHLPPLEFPLEPDPARRLRLTPLKDKTDLPQSFWQKKKTKLVGLFTCDSEKQSSSEFLNPSGASIRNSKPSASSSSLWTTKQFVPTRLFFIKTEISAQFSLWPSG